MSNREIVINLIEKLPQEMPLQDIAREIELIAGVRKAREEAARAEGHTAAISLAGAGASKKR